MSVPLDVPMLDEYPLTMDFDPSGRIVLGVYGTGVPQHGLILRVWP